MREIAFENRVVGVAGRAFNASTEGGIQIAVQGIQIAYVKFEFFAKEGLKSIIVRFESFCLTFSL